MYKFQGLVYICFIILFFIVVYLIKNMIIKYIFYILEGGILIKYISIKIILYIIKFLIIQMIFYDNVKENFVKRDRLYFFLNQFGNLKVYYFRGNNVVICYWIILKDYKIFFS